MSKAYEEPAFSFFSATEAMGYMDRANGDELDAALTVARERSAEVGSESDLIDVHHALFIIRRALGESAPSYDEMRVRLRERAR